MADRMNETERINDGNEATFHIYILSLAYGALAVSKSTLANALSGYPLATPPPPPPPHVARHSWPPALALAVEEENALQD